MPSSARIASLVETEDRREKGESNSREKKTRESRAGNYDAYKHQIYPRRIYGDKEMKWLQTLCNRGLDVLTFNYMAPLNTEVLQTQPRT